MAYDLQSNLGADNRENAGGLKNYLHLAHVSTFTALQDYDTYAAAGDYVKISSDHTFGASDGFTKLQVVADSLKRTAKGPEGRDSSGYMGTVEGLVVGTDEAITAEVLHKLQTGEVIALLETANGKVEQLGRAGFPAQVRFTEDTTGTTVEGQNAQSIQVVFNQQRKMYYEGTITPKP
ncbi:MAG: hypothetical protein ACPG5W_00555 [Flavobacteriales bacterium]